MTAHVQIRVHTRATSGLVIRGPAGKEGDESALLRKTLLVLGEGL